MNLGSGEGSVNMVELNVSFSWNPLSYWQHWHPTHNSIYKGHFSLFPSSPPLSCVPCVCVCLSVCDLFKPAWYPSEVCQSYCSAKDTTKRISLSSVPCLSLPLCFIQWLAFCTNSLIYPHIFTHIQTNSRATVGQTYNMRAFPHPRSVRTPLKMKAAVTD